MTSPTSKGHSRFLRALAIFFMSLPLICFALGFLQYRGAGYVERRRGILNADEIYWLPLLFILPIAAQFLTIYVLYKKSGKDRSVATFLLFCLWVMTLSPLGYCLLWSIYPRYGGQRLSFLALIGACALLVAVGVMTYAIIRVPREPSSVQLSKGEVYQVIDLCKKLKNKRPEGYGVVFPELPKDVRDVVKEIAETTVVNDTEKTRFVESINKHVLVSREFHDKLIHTIQPPDAEIERLIKDGKDGSLTDEGLQRGNRRILDYHLKEHVKKAGPFYRWWIENYLDHLHEGVSKTPFWALTFFFTVFLGITYLFAFAFAFHDRSVKSAGAVPALYMARNRPSDAVEEQSFAGSGASLAAFAWPDYVFYYIEDDTVVPVNSTQFRVEDYKELVRQKSELEKRREERTAEKERLEDERGNLEIQHSTLNYQRGLQQTLNNYTAVSQTDQLLKPVVSNINQHVTREKEIATELGEINDALKEKSSALLEQQGRWKGNINREHFERMLAAINAETSYGEGILIELKGGARQGGVNRPAQPPANSLLDERRWKLKYQVLTRLAESRAIPSSISWVDLPEELPPVPPPPNSSPLDKLNLEQLLHDPRQPRLVELVKTNLDENTSNALNQWLEELSTKNGDGQLIYAANPKLQGALQRLLGFVLEEGSSYVKEKNYSGKLGHALAEFREAYDGRSLVSFGETRGGDYITVAVKPLQKPQHAIPLGLMDYVYFTVYTITTTGYGDIVPTTTYAKFLCTFANIIEVFFLVVFFNVLLSMRLPDKLQAGIKRKA